LTQVRRFCAGAERLMAAATTRLGLPARGHDRVLEVARTIVDLDLRDSIRLEDCAQACHCRGPDHRWQG
jgi:magnesium chelatase family protein